MKRIISLFCLLSPLLHAGLRLQNDSPYKLRAVVRGADGTYLGELVVLAGGGAAWSEEYASFGTPVPPNPTHSMTPFMVQWFCMDGGTYGVCMNQAAGATVIASGSDGARSCKVPPKQKKSPYGANPDDEQLQNQAQTPSEDNPSTESP